MEKDFDLDEDGYTLVEFSDEENDKEYVEWYQKTQVSPELIEVVETKQLTSSNISSFDFTDLVRGAYYNDYLKTCLMDFLGLHPLPLSTYIIDKGKKVFCKLFPHQVKTLEFMRKRESLIPDDVYGLKGGIIKLEMGLGKSLATITHSLIAGRPSYPEEYGENGFPTLIIASKTVMIEWKTEGFEKFFGNRVKVLYLRRDFIGNLFETITRKQLVEYDFVLTTYDICSEAYRKLNIKQDNSELEKLLCKKTRKKLPIRCRERYLSNNPNAVGVSIIYSTPFQRCILDESQRICNPDTKSFTHVMTIYGRYKWCLTGTPIKNKSIDLWSQLKFCGYNGTELKRDWDARSCDIMKKHSLSEAILNMDYVSVGIKLPKKIKKDQSVDLKGKERECYDYIENISNKVIKLIEIGFEEFVKIRVLLIRLRQCAIAPYLLTIESKREKGKLSLEDKKNQELTSLIKEVYNGELGKWIKDKHGTAGIYSSKITEVIEIINEIPDGEKVLVFSSFTSALDLIGCAIKERLPHIKFLHLDGDTKNLDRELILKRFKTEIDMKCLLLTYKVGSEGLNLIEANHIIRVEPWWTDSVHDQADSRSHRIGQEKEVTVYCIYTKNTVEERVIEICKRKGEMISEMLDGTYQQLSLNKGLNIDVIKLIIGNSD